MKYNDRDSSFAPSLDQDAGDDWQSLGAGFRLDGVSNESDRWSLLGDVYDTDANQIMRRDPQDPDDPANNPPDPTSPYIDQNVPSSVDANGWNLLGLWEHQISEHAATTLQLYYDYSDRKDSGLELSYDLSQITWSNCQVS